MFNALLKEHKTRDPFVIAENIGIVILKENLGSIKGYYNTVYGFKFIHINKNLSEREEKIVAAHELGHALLHPEHCTPFMRANTYYSINKFEIEANVFAVDLLISDEDIKDNINLTSIQMAALFDLPQVLMELRLKSFKNNPKNSNYGLNFFNFDF